MKIPITLSICNNTLSSIITDAHDQKIKNYKKNRKVVLQDNSTNITRQHHKSSFSKSDVFKKETVHKHRYRPIIDLRFLP
jgi:hypothetical protein